MLTPLVVRRFRPADVMAGGLVVAAVGFALLAQVSAATRGLRRSGRRVGDLCRSAWRRCSRWPPTSIISAAPPERAGAAAAISETSAEFGGALGIAVFGSIGTAVYRSALADTVPAGLAA